MATCKGDCEERERPSEHPNFAGVKKKIMVLSGKGGADGRKEEGMEVYAVPTENGFLCAHFGHCGKFTLVEAGDGKEPAVREVCDPPPHEPGVLPRWLAEKGVKAVIAGGIGARAQQIFAASGVKVLCGAPALEPLRLVKDYLEGTLELGDNVCDH